MQNKLKDSFGFLSAFLARQSTANGVALLLGLYFVWTLGALIAQQLNPPAPIQLPKLAPIQTQIADSSHTSYIFGKPDASETQNQPALDLTSIHTTRLNLKLVGVIETGKRNVALIQKPGESVAVFEGEHIQPGVILLQVRDNQAVISNNGIKEKLILESHDQDLLSTNTANSLHNGVNNGKGAISLQTAANLVRRSPAAITQFVRFEIQSTQGRISGIKVWPTQQASLFNKMGFENGDIVTQINGQPVNDIIKNPANWQTFLSKDTFAFTINRKGQTQELQVDLNQLD